MLVGLLCVHLLLELSFSCLCLSSCFVHGRTTHFVAYLLVQSGTVVAMSPVGNAVRGCSRRPPIERCSTTVRGSVVWDYRLPLLVHLSFTYKESSAPISLWISLSLSFSLSLSVKTGIATPDGSYCSRTCSSAARPRVCTNA